MASNQERAFVLGPSYNRAMDQRRSYAMPVIAAVLLLLPLLYVVIYLLLVVPQGLPTLASASGQFLISQPASNQTTLSLALTALAAREHYRYGGSWSETIFCPLEHFDRKLRPAAWDEGQEYMINVNTMQSIRLKGPIKVTTPDAVGNQDEPDVSSVDP